jgi:8-amino-7-oxononanoate synthase
LNEAGAVLWGETCFDQREASLSAEGELVIAGRQSVPDPRPPTNGAERWARELAIRAQAGLQRRVRRWSPGEGELNLAGNDYLELARDPALAEAMAASARAEGASASASPLISGWRDAHDDLVASLCAWHGFAEGLVWTSGFAANAGVLGTLPRAGDLVLADRLIHHSMVAGARKSGARLQRYPHLNLNALERMLVREARSGAGRAVFVATESVFSMDGDSPDLRRLAALRRRFGFCWILDEAHALGWYGRTGAGLAEEKGVASEVDVLVGTCGKALGAGGAYTLFQGGPWREALVNHAGEFIYSTGLPPPVAAAARAAVGRVRELAVGQAGWRDTSRAFRACLRATGWSAAEGDSPIVPVMLGDPTRATVLAGRLRETGVLAAAVRPPTVPTGTSRLRFSLTRSFGVAEALRVVTALGPEGAGQ